MKLISPMLLALILFSCSTEEGKLTPITPDMDSFVFGVSYGMCMGDCADLFMIQGEAVFSDRNERYYNEELSFVAIPLGTDAYTEAKAILNDLPLTQLKEETDNRIGMPDAYDQGTIHILKSIDGEWKEFFIDTDDKNLPEYLIAYSQKLLSTIDSLKTK